MGKDFSERSQLVLHALVQRYIHEGQPVGSKALAQALPLSLSPATLRNVMADLEDRGFIHSPHTSAGRVPTALGYRFFVNGLISSPPGDLTPLLPDLSAGLAPDRSPQELIETASQLLSSITGQAGVVTLPSTSSASFRQVEFLPLSGSRVLVILVLNEREVQNRIIHTDRAFSERDLARAATYINRRFAGQDLAQVRAALVEGMRADQARIDALMHSVIEVAACAFAPAEDAKDYVIAGQSNLLAADNADMERLRKLFGAFQKKNDILHLLDRCMAANGIQIFIGEESGYEVLDDYSVITSPYQIGGRPLGVLGVIGPTRMAYDRVIPIVDLTARMLGAALSS